jgi:phage gp36-like protein
MPYATTAQMIARFTEREVIALTDRTGAGVVDAVQLADAIAQAGAEIDAHLGRRYQLPLAAGGTPLATPPQILVGLCCDIARYRLTGTEVQETEAIRVRYKDALHMLTKLGNGETVFSESPDLLGAGNANAQGAAVKANQRCRLFPAGHAGGY